jgi:DNA-binding LacI/PurR family transcriptional regulator
MPARGNARLVERREGATLEEVAAAAGVSRATVSRVVNGLDRVSPKTRQSVLRAVDRLGYTPNRVARSLATRRTDSVALVIPEPATKLFGDPFFPRLVVGIGEVLSAADKQLVLLAPQSRDDEDRLERYLLAAQADGVLLVSLHGNNPLPEHLNQRGVPLVVGGRPHGQGISYVDVDNVQGAMSAVRHLLASGRRQIATITGPPDMAPSADRLEGYRRALREAGIEVDPALEAPGQFEQDLARRSMTELLERRPELDAVFVASDLMAAGALQALRRAGRRVPDDVAIVGYDDSQLATSVDPPLSSVRQPTEDMGREMARLLLTSITARQHVARRVILDTQLVVRQSSGGEAAD